MPSKPPVQGDHWSYNGSVYKVLQVSSGTDQVFLQDVSDKKEYAVRYGIFLNSYKRVLKVGEVAEWLNRTSRSMYRYEARGQIKKATQYPYGSRQIRFYSLDEILEIHEMISGLHRGRPRKDGRIINNTLPDIGTLRLEMKERYGEWQKIK